MVLVLGSASMNASFGMLSGPVLFPLEFLYSSVQCFCVYRFYF